MKTTRPWRQETLALMRGRFSRNLMLRIISSATESW